MPDFSFIHEIVEVVTPGCIAWFVGVGALFGIGVALILGRRDARRFSLLSEAMDEGVIVHENGRATEVNDAVLRMTGFSREELLRVNLVDVIVHPESRATVIASIRNGNEKPYTAIGFRKDGTSYPAEVRPKVVHTAFGRKRIVVIRDLSSLQAAEAAREESDERYRTLIECTVEALVFHKNGIVIDVNPAFSELLGYKREEVVGKNVIEITVVPEEIEGVMRRIAARDQRPYETRGRRRDGKVLDLEIIPREVTRDGRSFRVTAMRDITLRKRAEARLARQVSLHQATLEASDEGVLVVDSRGHIESSNTRFAEMWNIPEDLLTAGEDTPLIDHVLRAVVAPTAFLAKIRELHAYPSAESDDIVELRDGRIFERHSRPQILYGIPVGRVWSFRDVTGLEKTRRELRRQIDLLDSTLQAASEGILAVDAKDRVLTFNGRLASMWGLKADFPAESGAFLADVERAELLEGRGPSPSGDVGKAELLRLKDGRVFERTEHPYRSDGGSAGRVFSYRDVSAHTHETDRLRHFNADLEARVKDRTAELERANVTLRSSNAELEAFSFSVSHDLRSPLRGVDGLSLALSEEYAEILDETGREYVRRIRAGVQRMGRIMDDLIHLSRINRTEMKLEAVDISSLVKGLVATLRQDAPERTVVVDIADGAFAYGDRRLLRVMLENLVGNAWKYTSKKPAAVIVFGFRDLPDNRREFFIRDNGAGFDPAYKDKLFATFTRLHGPNEFEGSGLGLAIVGRIIRRHSGKITADALPDKGATFTFTLPTSPEGMSAS